MMMDMESIRRQLEVARAQAIAVVGTVDAALALVPPAASEPEKKEAKFLGEK